MKKLLLLLLLSQTFYAQKTYKFDYVLELDSKIIDNKKDTISFILVNSKKNDYFCYVNYLDSINYELKLLHFDNLISKSIGKINDINNAEIINPPCNSIFKYSNPYKYQTKNYDYFNLKDTLVEGTLFYHYVLKSNRSIKYQKRKKISSLHFIVDKQSSEFMPFLYHVTAYEEWKKEKNIPNGKLKMMYYVNLDNKITKKYTIKNILKIDKKIVIPTDCD